MKSLINALENKILLLDGAMGTEIIAKGIKLPNFIWSAHTNLQNPSLIYDIHKKYIDVGSDMPIA